ncbi:membrane protein required for colicin V production [Rhodoligotrophos appendicifer]|uniref:CvpA family protein n=1 Tax=Rhodoligotrophos appendicifer TaxID=987056 RepID=UPI001186797D|nr:CvpA family protein [Rhodoligotrophos appendicifer]
MPFSMLDVILIGIMLISGLLALMRGFTREVLSILSWAGAALAAFLAYTGFRETARSYIQPDYVADIALVAGTFVIVLIIISIITIKISDWILDSGVGALDRTLGFVFGMARGLLLVVVAYIFFIWLVPVERRPDWVRNAATLPVIEQTSTFVISFLPPDVAETLLGKTYINAKPGEAPGAGTTGEDEPTTPGADGDEEDGYENPERQGIDQLLNDGNSTSSGNN